MTSYYLHIEHIRMCFHSLHSSQGTSIFHDDFAVVGFAQSKDRETCTALLTHLQQNVNIILGNLQNLFITEINFYTTKPMYIKMCILNMW